MPPSFASSSLLSFGYVAPGVTGHTRLDMATFWIELGLGVGLEIMVKECESYEALTRAVVAGEVDVAWLPPIPLVALERRKAAVPLVSNHRDGSSTFHSVIVAHRVSGMKRATEIVGKRAAWVDPYSASGYVLARIELARLGVDVRTAFPEERFHRSHLAAVVAVLDRRADFAATWVGRDAAGALVRAPWQDVAGGHAIRILQTFGVIPSDTIAARATLGLGEAEKVRKGLLAAASTQPHLVRELFGVDAFRPWAAEGYDVLHTTTARASEDGLLEGVERVAERRSGSGKVYLPSLAGPPRR